MASATYQDNDLLLLGFELFELLPDAILVVDGRGVIRYANRQAGRMFAKEPATLVSTPVEALLPEHLRERHIAHRAKYNLEPRRRPMGRGLDLVARRADGTTCPVDIMLNPLRHLAEPMTLAVVRDVTDRRAAEEAVRQSRTMFEKFYGQSPDAIIVVDEAGEIVRVNGPAEALFGFPRQRMVGQSIEMLLPERFRNRHSAHRAGYMKEAKTRPMGTGLPLFAQRADGSEFPVDIMLSPMGIDQRRLVLAVVRDTTTRKNAEEVQAHLAAIVASSTDAIIGKTLDGIVTSWNEAAERMFGYQASEMIGQPIRRLIPTDRQAEEDMILGRLAQGERIEHYETIRKAKDGRTIDVAVTVSPVRGAEGRVIGASKIVRDIAARKQAEEALRKSEGPQSSTLRCQRSYSTIRSKSLPSVKAGSTKPATRDRSCNTSRTGRLALTVNSQARCWRKSASPFQQSPRGSDPSGRSEPKTAAIGFGASFLLCWGPNRMDDACILPSLKI